MNILAIDTTNNMCSVSVSCNNNIITNIDENNITHSEKLLPLINTTLCQSNLNVSDIELFAVTNGPGSFTGVRIGVSSIKALAISKDVQIAVITSLKLIAYMAYKQSKHEYICPLLDAKNGRAYYSLYKINNLNGKITYEEIYNIDNTEICDILNNLKQYDNILYVSDNIDNFKPYLINYINYNILPNSNDLMDYIINNKNVDLYNSYNLDVIYARVSQAERVKNGTN